MLPMQQNQLKPEALRPLNLQQQQYQARQRQIKLELRRARCSQIFTQRPTQEKCQWWCEQIGDLCTWVVIPFLVSITFLYIAAAASSR